MFSEAKVTEIYCLADDFCKEFAKYQENHMLPPFTRVASIVISPIVWVMPKSCWSWFYSIPVDTGASNISIWNMCVNTWHICFPGKYPTTVLLNWKRKSCFLRLYYQNGIDRQMYWNQFRGFHTATCLPQPKNTYPQDVWRTGYSRKMFDGLVLRLQTTPDYQWQRRNTELHVYIRWCGW